MSKYKLIISDPTKCKLVRSDQERFGHKCPIITCSKCNIIFCYNCCFYTNIAIEHANKYMHMNDIGISILKCPKCKHDCYDDLRSELLVEGCEEHLWKWITSITQDSKEAWVIEKSMMVYMYEHDIIFTDELSFTELYEKIKTTTDYLEFYRKGNWYD